jgi:hypothetical protein
MSGTVFSEELAGRLHNLAVACVRLARAVKKGGMPPADAERLDGQVRGMFTELDKARRRLLVTPAPGEELKS